MPAVLGEARNRNVETVSPQELTTAVYPRAIESIPAQVKRELQEEIRSFLDSHIRVA